MEKNSDLAKAETLNGGKLCKYHRDSGLTWEQYLQADSFDRDITGNIKHSGEGIKMAISARTREIIASNDALSREFGTSFDSINSTLEWGFGRVANEISELRADFRYGMVLALEQLRIQQNTFDDILDRLDAIHETLKYPLHTQARELLKTGLERLQRGLLPEALKALLKSAGKNETDFLVQLQIGKLYLYGHSQTDNVIDLPKAEKHLRLAARYAESEIQHIPDAAKFCGEAFLHAAISCYAQANERWLAGDAETAKHFIKQALELSQNATKVYPQLAEAFYHHAKFAALLGDGETAINSLRTAILSDRNYCIRADADRDFDGVREHIFKLFESLGQEVKPKAAKNIETVRTLLKDWVYQSEEAKQAESEIRKALDQAESFYRNKSTYFDSLDVLSFLNEAQETFDQIPSFSFKEVVILDSNWSPAFSPDGRYVAIKNSDDICKIYQTDGFKEIISSKYSPHFSPDGSYVAIKSSHDICKIYQTDGFKEIATLNSKWSPIFSPDGRYVVIKSSYDTCKIYQTNGFKEIATLNGYPYFSPDGKYVASGSSYDTCKIYQTDGFKEITTLNSRWSPVFSPDGKYVASGSGDDTCKIYQTDGFKEITTLNSRWSPVFSPDGRYVAIKSSDYTYKIYQTDGFKEITTLNSRWSPIFSPDGKYVASGSGDDACKIYQTDGFKEIINSKWSPIFSPDGRYVAIKSSDYAYKIHQTDGFKEIITLSSKWSPIFSPDGKYLASGSSDDTCKIYQRIKCTIPRQEFEEHEKRRIELEREAERRMEEERRQKEAEYRRKEEEERQKREAERERKEQKLREYRRQNKLCLECGAKLSFWDKLSDEQYCKRHRT